MARVMACAPFAVVLAAVSALAGCAVGPDYARPAVDVPAVYKEIGLWKPAAPGRIDAEHPWWQLYGDATLDGLIAQANTANQNIRQAEAQYRQAQALADQARAAFWPGIGASVGASRARSDTSVVRTGDSATAGLTASWVPDLWGAVRRSVEAGDAGAAASADDLAAPVSAFQAALAQDYLQLRVTDLLRDQYDETVAPTRRRWRSRAARTGPAWRCAPTCARGGAARDRAGARRRPRGQPGPARARDRDPHRPAAGRLHTGAPRRARR